MSDKISMRNNLLFLNKILKGFSDNDLIIAPNVRCFFNTTQKTLNNESSKAKTITNIRLPKNMILRHCSPTHSALLLDGMLKPVQLTTVPRPLALIFSWMFAKDIHLEKYRQLWFKREFDVLTVRTSLFDSLLPPIGGRVVAQNLVKSLSELNSHYNEIVVHAFSVGGYQLGETLLLMREQDKELKMMKCIKGVIFDSLVFPQDVAPGLSRAITLNTTLQPIIEKSFYLYLKLFNNISVKYHLKTEQIVINPLVKYPGLIFYSKNDFVSSIASNERLAQNWNKIGNQMRTKCWDESRHVLHYREHPKEYEQELDAFIKNLKLRNSRI